MQEKIQKTLEDNGFTIKELEDIDEINTIFERLESEGIIDYGVYVRSNDSGDYWLQCEYYSKKIRKTIILDCDFTSYFEDEDDLINKCIEVQENVIDFESRLSIKE